MTDQEKAQKKRIEELTALLITHDYKGVAVKRQALDELLEIYWQDGKKTGMK